VRRHKYEEKINIIINFSFRVMVLVPAFASAAQLKGKIQHTIPGGGTKVIINSQVEKVVYSKYAYLDLYSTTVHNNPQNDYSLTTYYSRVRTSGGSNASVCILLMVIRITQDLV
jgi:hypothetical protein